MLLGVSGIDKKDNIREAWVAYVENGKYKPGLLALVSPVICDVSVYHLVSKPCSVKSVDPWGQVAKSPGYQSGLAMACVRPAVLREPGDPPFRLPGSCCPWLASFEATHSWTNPCGRPKIPVDLSSFATRIAILKCQRGICDTRVAIERGGRGLAAGPPSLWDP